MDQTAFPARRQQCERTRQHSNHPPRPCRDRFLSHLRYVAPRRFTTLRIPCVMRVNATSGLFQRLRVPRSITADKLFKKPVQQGRSNARGRGVPLRYVEPRSDERTPLAGFFNSLSDAPGARALDQVRLLLLELLHHQGDGFLWTFHRSDQASAQLFEEFLFGRCGPDQNDRLPCL